MGFELDPKRAVLNSYGVRNTNSAYGAEISDEIIRSVSVEFQAPTSGAGDATNGMAAAAWAKGGLDVIIPVGAIFLRSNVIVETAFNTLTALTIGTYRSSDGTTAIAVEGLVAAAGSGLATINAAGSRIVGAGTQLVSGTAGLGATLFSSVIRVLYTGTVPTTGKARLIVEYVLRAP